MTSTAPTCNLGAGLTCEGKATLSLSAAYQRKNPTVMTGKTTFTVGNLNFSATSYQLLLTSLTSSGPWALYWGTGTVNGVPGYSFRITALQPASRTYRMRIQIWNAGGVVYDNQPGTPDDAPLTGSSTLLTSGSISIRY